MRAVGGGGNFRERARAFGGAILGVAGMFNDFEDLAFDDAADAIEVGAALALEIARVVWFAAQPENEADNGEHGNSSQRKPFVPIAKQFFQREPFPVWINLARR